MVARVSLTGSSQKLSLPSLYDILGFCSSFKVGLQNFFAMVYHVAGENHITLIA